MILSDTCPCHRIVPSSEFQISSPDIFQALTYPVHSPWSGPFTTASHILKATQKSQIERDLRGLVSRFQISWNLDYQTICLLGISSIGAVNEVYDQEARACYAGPIVLVQGAYTPFIDRSSPSLLALAIFFRHRSFSKGPPSVKTLKLIAFEEHESNSIRDLLRDSIFLSSSVQKCGRFDSKPMPSHMY
ncbi:hypothetical protein TIFTF001_026090 [Ficus carica]|uniref:Uncharacterized protein n=1 Tax=Ficus carica TaxID=3494 RepID=A0AA88B1T1_FICCA|nr:hypothetical protein TIFTF001_026090 [Ficus carica]